MALDASNSSRRYDLDRLRVCALALLIFTHSLYVYRTDGWRVQSEQAGLWADILISVIAPWRISVVFFIAGAATRFMLERHDFWSFVNNRAMRLFAPFMMALVVLVPVMQYIAAPHSRGTGTYFDFLRGAGFHSHETFGFWLPDFGHVWFLLYAFVYALVAGLIWRLRRSAFRFADRVITAAPVWAVVAVLSFCFVVADAVLEPIFPRTNMFVDDPAGHLRCIAPFILGLFLARPSAFWTRLKAARGWLIPLALSLFVLSIPLSLKLLLLSGQTKLALVLLEGTASGLYGAAMMFLILSFASALPNRAGPALGYFGDAIMPIYLMHQPVIVFVATALHGAGLPAWAEFGLVLGLAGGFPLLVYHFIIRPTPALRIACGLKATTARREPIAQPSH